MREGWLATDGTVASVEQFQTKAGSGYTVVFTYKVDGGWYGGTYTTFEYVQKGDLIAVQYDPANPDRNNFTQREGWLRIFYIVFFIALGILAIYLFMQPKVK